MFVSAGVSGTMLAEVNVSADSVELRGSSIFRSCNKASSAVLTGDAAWAVPLDGSGIVFMGACPGAERSKYTALGIGGCN